MSFYLSIEDLSGDPIEVTPAESSRVIYSANYMCEVSGFTALLDEIATYLESGSSSVPFTTSISRASGNLLLGLITTLPNGAGPYVRLIKTSGLTSDKSHGSDSSVGVISKPGFQVLIEGSNSSEVELLAHEIHDYLIPTTNKSIVAA